jgi:hypothetical protein
MNNVNTEAISEANQETYDRLIVSLEAGIGSLQIFIAVCDGAIQRAEIIHRYEQELSPHIKSYQVYLDAQEPSLRKAVADAISSHENTIVTVLGAESLGFLEQDESLKKFFGYLQWTREALRELRLPIVLWVPKRILKLIAKNSPDFWSWCNGVFQFQVESTLAYDQALQEERIALQSLFEWKENVLRISLRAKNFEIDPSREFELKHRIASKKTELKKLQDRLDEIEQSLQRRADG